MLHNTIKNIKKCIWYLSDDIEDFADYDDFVKYLQTASDEDVCILKINSGGGRVDVGTHVIKAIKSSQASVIAHVVYPSASMASMIACACDTLILDPDTYLMFHTYSGGSWGKSGDVLQDVEETHRCLEGMANKITGPFLTKKELQQIKDGKSIYVRWDDDNLKTRIKRHYKNWVHSD